MPFLSFIVAYRNRDLNRVRSLLDSLEKQSLKTFEVIFVDYGSDKNISAELNSILRKYNFASYHFLNTRGQNWNRGKCLNYGFRKASGDYIFTCDIDFVFAPEFLNKLK